jgi:putative spermidine/putrescine transport system permease protein
MSSTAQDVTDATTARRAPTPDDALRIADSGDAGPMLAADGRPLRVSLARALRRQKLRALMLTAPLLLFILVAFVAPILDMLYYSVDNEIVPDTLPRTTEALEEWDPHSGELPPEPVFRGLFFDLVLAAEAKEHTGVGSRLNYELSGMSSLFRGSGRDIDDIGEAYKEALVGISPQWEEAGFWHALMAAAGGEADDDLLDRAHAGLEDLIDEPLRGELSFAPGAAIAAALPRTSEAYASFALWTGLVDGDDVAEEEPWDAVHAALALDLAEPASSEAALAYQGPGAEVLHETARRADELPPVDFRAAFVDADDDWGDLATWQTLWRYSDALTAGYFLNAVDMEPTVDGPQFKPERERIYLKLFWRTLLLSVTITVCCLLLGYPVAYLLASLPLGVSNLLMILVLLPFWTSLLVRTSSWIVLLQQNGVINDVLVAIGIISNNNRLQMMFNEIGTIVAMTHILLPFMILPLYSVMKTISPSYVRAARSLGATDWTAFWRVYFPQSVPGIGAGAILVFILSIGYYITPELVGGTNGIFISNRIAYHISASLNWGLAAALGVILLTAVMVLYWVYDRIVGIDNVKLG